MAISGGVISVHTGTDIANLVLDAYFRGSVFAQTIQDKPLLRILNSKKKSFPAGKEYLSSPVQGAYMSDTAGFLTGFSEDDQLAFAQAQNVLRVQYAWKELHAGLVITETELKKDGISITDDMNVQEHPDTLVRLTSVLENRLADFGESWARSMNEMLWKDGSQDSKAIPGLTSILTDTPTTGTTGALNRATYSWWRHRLNLGLSASEENQTLSKFLRQEIRQLKRYGGNPNVAICGSDFIAALESEYQSKGQYTDSGFTKGGDLGMGKISIMGLGTFEYDPTLDTMGMSKRCYIFDDRRITLRPMEGEDNKTRKPSRPYDYFLFLQSKTYTGALECTQLNCNAVYAIA